MFLLGGGAITWSSRKQSSVALLTIEAEYMALSVATQEAIWLRHLQEELRMTDTGPTLIYEDNQGAISLAKNPVFHKRTKLVQIRYHFVRDAVEQGTIILEYCRTDECWQTVSRKHWLVTILKSCEQALDLCEGNPAKAVNFESCELLIVGSSSCCIC